MKQYLQQIKTFPVLTAEEEYMLAKRWQEHGDIAAAHRLTTSHLRLVAKIAMGYRGYGLPTPDLIAEGNIGLMQAVKRYDPDHGNRLSTYAMWWIKAAIQEYVLRSWSLVKMGTSAAQKRLFFNLKKLRRKLGVAHEGELTRDNVKKIARQLEVEEQDVVDMDRRMLASDQHLNQRIGHDGEDEWMDRVAETGPDQEMMLGDEEELAQKRLMMERAMSGLNEREREIIVERRLKEPATTLEDLSQKFGISRERVRQIEVRALEKLQEAIAQQVIDTAEGRA